MYKTIRRIAAIGIVTEAAPAPEPQLRVGATLQARIPAPCRPAARHRPCFKQHAAGVTAHLRGGTRSEACGSDRGLRLYGRHLRRELRKLRTCVECHCGGCRRAGLPALADTDSAGHSDRDLLKQILKTVIEHR